MLRTIPRLFSKPLSRGFLAGLHATGDRPEYDNFADAYEAISQVPDNLLAEFESELMEGQGREFIYGSKLVSVIDTTTSTSTSTSTLPTKETLRTLILNERPNLVQTCIKVPGPAGSQFISDGAPSPISETHLGGLALTLLLSPSSSPSCVIVGAGGCTLPHTISVFNESGSVVAVEPCEEVCAAARQWFGVTPSCGFELVTDFGEPYLSSLSQSPNSLDILILDADDGSVPPRSMQEPNFWSDVVRPVLHEEGVVGVNVIGDQETQELLQDTLESNLPNHSVVRVRAPVEADVDVDRHSLFFATPYKIDADELERRLKEYLVVSDAAAWLREVRKSVISI
ncbi:hypothetical protein TL16_g07428 [Triparma laevis f. inornata]|uniref:Uncharacterized protein n=2 Tax=Triparma laevis TaxID=1534972 RepID=A0A9W7KZ42_9STRA|nr:hypothetical protein TL16_g07428 [Triparma laevis f. inornata]GMI16416.1 hypothetical protein TrLO_g12306 [Triparma laevis f. longispina]